MDFGLNESVNVPTFRDIQVFRLDGGFLTIAADTLGAIGEKSGDRFRVAPEICARMTARVCLMETLAAGARPFALTALTCNEREPTGMRFMDGIRRELKDAGFPDLPVGGSTEDNMPTNMTALGITLLGQCESLSWRLAEEGDGVYLLGRPYVGEDVLAHFDELPDVLLIRRLRESSHVGDMLPCGSRGIARELEVLERETGLSVRRDPGIDRAFLQKSAGPATCVVFTASAPLESIRNKQNYQNYQNYMNNVIRIGTLAP